MDFPSSAKRPQELKDISADWYTQQLQLSLEALQLCYIPESCSQICWAKTAGLSSLIFHHKTCTENVLMEEHKSLPLSARKQEMLSVHKNTYVDWSRVLFLRQEGEMLLCCLWTARTYSEFWPWYIVHLNSFRTQSHSVLWCAVQQELIKTGPCPLVQSLTELKPCHTDLLPTGLLHGLFSWMS